MSIRRLVAVARKEFRHITRDVCTFFLVTVAPAFLLVTLSYVFAFDVDRVDVAIRDLYRTPLSREFVASLRPRLVNDTGGGFAVGFDVSSRAWGS